MFLHNVYLYFCIPPCLIVWFSIELGLGYLLSLIAVDFKTICQPRRRQIS